MAILGANYESALAWFSSLRGMHFLNFVSFSFRANKTKNFENILIVTNFILYSCIYLYMPYSIKYIIQVITIYLHIPN